MADPLTNDRTRVQQGEGQDHGQRVGFAARAILLAVGALVALIAVLRRAVTREVVVDPSPSVDPRGGEATAETESIDQRAGEATARPEPIPERSGIAPTIGEILSTAFGDLLVTPGRGSDFIVQLGDKRIAVNVHLNLRPSSSPTVVADQAFLHALAYFVPRVPTASGTDPRPVVNGVVMVIGNAQLFALLPTHPRERMRVVPWLASTDDDAIVAAIRELAT
jgi:hypothetical protein